MRYFKSVNNNYIIGVGTGNICTEISEAEYHRITEFFHSKPIAPEGYDYRLKDNLTWECYEQPPME